MHAEVHGDGTPVLFLHGAGVAGWIWRQAAAEVRDARDNVQTIAVDLPGFGRSAESTYPGADATVAELSELIRDRGPAVVVGFSLGSQLALRLASLAPDLVRGLVWISGETRPTPFPWATGVGAGAAAALGRVPALASRQAAQAGVPVPLRSEYLSDLRAMRVDSVRRSVDENQRFRAPVTIDRYHGPAVALAGSRERRIVRESADRLPELIPGAAVEVVAGAKHHIPYRFPERVAAATLGMLDAGR